MTNTFTPRLGLILQAYGSNPETWGTELNNAVIALVDDMLAVEPIVVDSDVVLTADDGFENQVRRQLLVFTGAGGHTVTVKAVDRWYLVHNKCAADVTIKPDGGTGATVRAGTCLFWTTDGSTAETIDIPLDKIRKPEADLDLNGKKITNAGRGENTSDVATLENEIGDFAKPTSDFDFNAQKAVNLAKGSDPTDVATLENEIGDFAKLTTAYDANGQRFTNLGAPSAPADAATKAYIDTLAASSDLGIVASVADEIRTLADIQDGTVATGVLTDLAPIADEIAIVAGVSDEVERVSGMFCGEGTTDPATRLDGSPLQVGDFYLNTYTEIPAIRVYTGTIWVAFEAITFATPEEAKTGTGNGVMTAALTAQAIGALAGDVVYEVFETSGTFTKEDDDIAYYVECIGGGGSGAKGTSNYNNITGGLPGHVVSRFFAAHDVDSEESVTVGAGGAGLPSSVGENNWEAGNAGGYSAFGDKLYASGGLGGRAFSAVLTFVYGDIGAQAIAAETAAYQSLSRLRGDRTLGGATDLNQGSLALMGPTAGEAMQNLTKRGRPLSIGYGSGGAASTAESVSAGDGEAPGGGGGAYHNDISHTGSSGAGGRGEVRIYRFKRVKQ